MFKRNFFIFLLICLVGFLILPKISLAENIEDISLQEMGKYLELPPQDVQNLIYTLKQVLTTEGIYLWSSGYTADEQIAAAVILLNVVKVEVLNHLLIDAPIEVTWGIIKNAIKIARVVLAEDPTIVFEELEKESVNKAVDYGMKTLLQNEIRVTPGAIKFRYFSSKGGEEEIIFQYVMIYKPIGAKRGEVKIRFYLSNPIDPPDPNKFSRLLRVPNLENDLPPFIVEIKGIVEKNKYHNYQWVDENGRLIHPSINIDFPPEVPDLGIRPLSFFERQIWKPIITQIKDVEVIITKVTGKSPKITEKIFDIPKIAIEVWNKITGKIQELTRFGGAQVMPPSEEKPEKEPEQKLEKEEPKKEKVETPRDDEVKPRQPEQTKPPDLNEVRKNLTEISKTIEALSKRVKELSNVDIKRQQEIEEEGKKDKEKVEEEQPQKEKEIQKETKKEQSQITICQKKSGDFPQRNKVIFNEIAWMGTTNSANDEWIELKNISNNDVDLAGWQILDKDNQIKVIFTNQHRVLVNGFWLLERTNDDTVPGVVADVIYTGGLNNSDEVLYLFDKNCQLQDEVLANPDWPAGNNSTKRTMERRVDLNWQTSVNSGGTPKRENSSGYVEYYGGGSFSSGSSRLSLSSPPPDTSPPIANAGPDQTVIINQPISFDGSQSSDNVKIVSFQWDIDNKDGLNWNSPDLTGEKPTFTQGYSQSGIYIVTLRVSDKAGNSATDTLTITVTLPPKILITEIQIYTTASSSYDFVELYNPNNFDIDISGFQLKKKASTGSETSVRVFPTGSKILAQNYFLWANSNYALSGLISADATSTQTLAKNNSLSLFDKNGNLLDAVAWGSSTNPFVEGSPLSQNPEKNQSLGRKWTEGTGYQDTDNNSADFEFQFPTPKAKNETFRDIIPPETTILNKPSSLTNQTQAVFTFSSSEENSTFECKIDEENWQTCLSSQQYSNLSGGLHTFQVGAKDASQNLDSSPAQYQWQIDTTPPQTEILTHPPSLTNQTQATFTFYANEENSFFEYKLDNDLEWQATTSPAKFTNLIDSEHKFQVRAIDPAGNINPEPAGHSWTIDTSIKSPSIFLADLDLNTTSTDWTNGKTVRVTFLDDEEAVAWLLSENQGAQPEIDNPNWLTEKPATTILSENNGPKTVYIWTKDGAGNISQLGNSASIILDTIPPTSQISQLGAFQTSATFTISWSGLDLTSGILEYEIQYATDTLNGVWLNWQKTDLTSAQFTGKDGFTYYFRSRAKDKAQNFGEFSKEASTTIDTTPPSVNFNAISSPQTQTSFLVSWTGGSVFHLRYSDDKINWTYYPESGWTSESQYQFSGEDETAYYFQIKARDEAGNESQWQELAITISVPKPVLIIETEKLEFTGIEYGLNPEPKSLPICNSGQADLQWEKTVFPEVNWLTINPISGQISPGNCLTTSVSVDISELHSGQYLTELLVNSNGGSKEIEIILKLEQDNVPPANANLVLADMVSESNFYTQNRIVKAAITNDQDGSFWLLSENQVKPEANSTDWQTKKPTTFTLSLGDGSKTVYIWTKDKAGNISELGKYASIILDTTPPIANAGSDKNVFTNGIITFDGSGSSDNIGIVSYQWDINQDGQWDLEGVSPIFEGGYSQLGQYLVTLKVSDAVSNSATDTLTVTVVSKILISEIQIWDAISTDHDFIELYNPSTTSVDISGFQLKKRNSAGNEESVLLFPDESIIPGQGYFLWVNSNFTSLLNLADATRTQTLAQNNSIALLDKNKNIVDALAWGSSTNPFVEGSPFSQNPEKGKTLARKIATTSEGVLTYIDNDNNSQDFEIQDPTPKARNHHQFPDLDGDGIIDSYDSTTTVTTTIPLKAGEYKFKNLVIMQGGKLVLNSSSSLAGFQGVKIVAENLIIDASSSISADGKGYPSNEGPGRGGLGRCDGGGSYGGIGGYNLATSTYGSSTQPTDLGSGGGGCDRPAGAGSGAIWLKIENSLIIDGVISANGENGLWRNGGWWATGGGSGGSIYIETNNFSGSGKIRANGGDVDSAGAGGGGRIAIIYNSRAGFSGKIQAFGGEYKCGITNCGSNGGPGTIYLKQKEQNYGDLIIDNNGQSGATELSGTSSTFKLLSIVNYARVYFSGNLTVENLQIKNNSALETATASQITVNGDFIIEEKSSLIGPAQIFLFINVAQGLIIQTESRLQGNFNIQTGNLTLATSSSISANGKGYPAEKGPGSLAGSTAGGSYGGLGGGNIANSTYGSSTQPTDFGSGGGGGGRPAGAGGGAIIITANELIFEGSTSSISANGENGLWRNGWWATGGGSGGSIYIETNNFSGSGKIRANGGDVDSAGAGGGGRIAIIYNSRAGFSGKIQAFGGEYKCGITNCGSNGGPGTIYLQKINEVGQLIITGSISLP